MNTRFFRAGAMLAGAAVIASTMTIHPATATSALRPVTPAKTKKCDSASACTAATNSGNGPGLAGFNTGIGDGVDGSSNNNNGLGGTTFNPSGKNGGRSGVYGVDGSSDGGNQNVGVTGQSYGAGTGVRGQSATGVGVVGWSYSGTGIEGLSFGNGPGLNALNYGSGPGMIGASSSEYAAIVAFGGSSGDSGGMSFEATQSNGIPSFWVTNDGNAHVAGLIYTGGTCSKGCDRTRGERVVSYAAQTSFPTIEDVGEGRLAGGQARIAIDAALARAIDQGSYVVFVTPEGESRGLYVTDKTPYGFTVAENEGGRSNVAFGYRIVAKPYGVKAARLPVMAAAKVPHAAVRPAR